MPKKTTSNTCRTCGFRGTFQDGSPACGLTNSTIKEDLTGFCDRHKHEDNVHHCEICQKISDKLYLYEHNDNYRFICQQCYSTFGTCNTCEKVNECGVLSDPTEPPFVMTTMQKGPMIVQTQIKNPNLIEKHCTTCKCAAPLDYKLCCKDENGVNCIAWQLSKVLLQ